MSNAPFYQVAFTPLTDGQQMPKDAGSRVTANGEILVAMSAGGVANPGDAAGAVSQPYAVTGNRWQYAAAAGGIVNTAVAVAFKAAAGAGLRNYITALQLDFDALNVATEVAIRDGAAGTVIWRTKIPAGAAGMREITFPTPLKGTANTLLEVVTLTASGAGGVFFNAQGYVAA